MYIANENRYEQMTYHRVGNSGLKLPKVSLGLWHNFGHTDRYDEMKELCFTAFDTGITHFDLANNYGPPEGSAEENFGRILKDGLNQYRDEIIISSKAGYYMWPGAYGEWGSRKNLMASLDQSLKRMNLDYVDIFYHHRPDPDTPLEETMSALAHMVRSGKALYVGISNYNMEQTAQAAKILKELGTPLLINQHRYSMLDRTMEDNGLKNWAAEHGLGLIAFSPLAQGLLTDRYLDEIPEDSRVRKDGRFLNENSLTEETLTKVRHLNEIAQSRGQTLAQMALSWVVKDGEVASVLIGASKIKQILDNAAIVDATPFTEDQLEAIEEALK